MITHSRNCHLGDAIWCLILLSRLEGNHVMHCNPEYHKELRELVEGLPIDITGCENIPTESIEFWIASGRYESKGLRYESQIDIMGFVMEYLNYMAEECGYEGPLKERRDLLCDFSSISHFGTANREKPILVINSDPKSGQCDGYSSSEMDELISKLSKRKRVISVHGKGYTLRNIGQMSRDSALIIGCATGPLWPCMNVWNESTLKIVMLDPQRLDYGNSSLIQHAANAAQVEDILLKDQWL